MERPRRCRDFKVSQRGRRFASSVSEGVVGQASAAVIRRIGCVVCGSAAAHLELGFISTWVANRPRHSAERRGGTATVAGAKVGLALITVLVFSLEVVLWDSSASSRLASESILVVPKVRLVANGVVVSGAFGCVDFRVSLIALVSIDIEVLINALVDGEVWEEAIVALAAISTFGQSLLAVNASSTAHFEALSGLVKNKLVR